MPNAADYFGLMAYIFVMHGGLPEPAPARSDARLARDEGRKAQLRTVGGTGKRTRWKSTTAPTAGEEAA